MHPERVLVHFSFLCFDKPFQRVSLRSSLDEMSWFAGSDGIALAFSSTLWFFAPCRINAPQLVGIEQPQESTKLSTMGTSTNPLYLERAKFSYHGTTI